MKKCILSLIKLLSKHHFLVFGGIFQLVFLFSLSFWTLFADSMNARVEKKLFDEMFLSCAYGFESMKTVSQNWLADVTWQLKTTCTTLGNTVAFWGSARLDQLFQKSFIIFYLDLFYSFPTFFQTALQTLELLLFLLCGVFNLFGEMFLSCAYGFENMRTASQNWLADVTGQLKTTCVTLMNAVTFEVLLRLDQCFKKVFHHVLFEFDILAHLFHFSKQLFKL